MKIEADPDPNVMDPQHCSVTYTYRNATVHTVIAMIYTARTICTVMFLIRVDPLRGQAGGGWALEIEPFSGPLKWHRAVRPFGPKKKVTKLIRNQENSCNFIFITLLCLRNPKSYFTQIILLF
jgi:hypothetical protein